MRHSKKGMSYFVAIIAVGVILTLILLVGTARAFTGNDSIVSAMTGELFKIRGDGCGNDADCNGNGVCVNGGCVCFENSQCKTVCDKSTGKCK